MADFLQWWKKMITFPVFTFAHDAIQKEIPNVISSLWLDCLRLKSVNWLTQMWVQPRNLRWSHLPLGSFGEGEHGQRKAWLLLEREDWVGLSSTCSSTVRKGGPNLEMLNVGQLKTASTIVHKRKKKNWMVFSFSFSSFYVFQMRHIPLIFSPDNSDSPEFKSPFLSSSFFVLSKISIEVSPQYSHRVMHWTDHILSNHLFNTFLFQWTTDSLRA